MKNKILTLKDGKQLFIVDEINYLNRRFIYGVECDTKSEQVSNTHLVLEAKVRNNVLVVDDIKEFAIASTVNNMFISRFARNLVAE